MRRICDGYMGSKVTRLTLGDPLGCRKATTVERLWDDLTGVSRGQSRHIDRAERAECDREMVVWSFADEGDADRDGWDAGVDTGG